MSYLVKAASDIACTIIKHHLDNGVQNIDKDFIARESAEMAVKIKEALKEHHEGVCDPDALTVATIDKLIAKHAITLHGLLHKRAE